jgi:hypothetical protein
VLPPAVRRFLEERIDDVEQLEIMLHLQRHVERSWCAADVADALRLGCRRAENQLEALAGRDLLDVRLGDDVRYRFKPTSDALAAAARQLAEWYCDHRSETVAFVTLVAGMIWDALAALSLLQPAQEARHWFFVIRLLGFVLILAAVVDKNRSSDE